MFQMDMFGSLFSYVGVELQLCYGMLLQHVHIVIVCTHLGALQPVLKFVKNIQHFGCIKGI